MKYLTHEHIVKYLTSFFDDQGYLNIVMEFCDSGSLSSYIKVMKSQQYIYHFYYIFFFTQNTNKAEFSAWRFLVHMSDALQYLHSQHPPIIHRDLKPDNILVQTNPNNGLKVCKIADFGIARVLNKNAYAEYYCGGTAIGTPIYMAPEALAVRQDI